MMQVKDGGKKKWNAGGKFQNLGKINILLKKQEIK